MLEKQLGQNAYINTKWQKLNNKRLKKYLNYFLSLNSLIVNNLFTKSFSSKIISRIKSIKLAYKSYV